MSENQDHAEQLKLVEETEMSAELFQAYCDFRAEQGLFVPELDSELSKLAYKEAFNCAELGKLTHRTELETNVLLSDVLQYATWKMKPTEAVRRWASSNGHRQQIQCVSARRAGAAAYLSATGTWFFAIIYDFKGSNQSPDSEVEAYRKNHPETAIKEQLKTQKYSPTDF